MKKMKTFGQEERYRCVSINLGMEKIRTLDGMTLDELDPWTLDRKEQKTLRRIVEKRMSQIHHKWNKGYKREYGNRRRHMMGRAVSYELFYIGMPSQVYSSKRHVARRYSKEDWLAA